MIIDVSQYQGLIDWDKAYAEVDFAIIRASVGTKRDTRVMRNMDECERLRIPYHVYHYIKALNAADADAEATVFARTAMEGDPLFLVIDCEYGKLSSMAKHNPKKLRSIIDVFMVTAREEYASEGMECPPFAVYIGHNCYKLWNLDYDRFAYVWIPRYGINDGKQHKRPDYPCDLWQYSSFGKCAGIKWRVDVSVLNGTKGMDFFKGQEETGMAVRIGSARIDERGKATGGAAGNQTGKELAAERWYLHKKGWNVLRAKDADDAEYIAKCMERSIMNRHIGYDQYQRLTLYNEAKKYGFDVDLVAKDVETDCSALVRVCCGCAGITVGNFTTQNEKSMLLATGAFEQLGGEKYERSCEYLRRGDILITKTKGHTAVVLDDGAKAETLVFGEYDLGDRELRNGMTGNDVRMAQELLIGRGYSCGDWGADGDFGDCTEDAVMTFQQDSDMEQTGIIDARTLSLLQSGEEEPKRDYLKIVGGNCYMRSAPGTDGLKLCVLLRGTDLVKLDHVEGWYKGQKVDGGMEGWFSERYAKEVDGLE